MEMLSAMGNGYHTTLEVCREHIDDANAAITVLHNTLNAFAEFYVDVTDNVFSRRASLSHNEYVNLFNSAMETLHDVSQLLANAKALAVGASLIAAGANSDEDMNDNQEVR